VTIATKALGGAVLTALLAAGPAAAAAAPGPQPAPGRVVFAIDDGHVAEDIDGTGVGGAVALPDGGALLIGGGAPRGGTTPLSRIGPTGAPDPAFGAGGVARVAAPFSVLQLLRRPDGRIVVIGAEISPPSSFTPDGLVVLQLTPEGAPDPTFGTAGLARTGIDEGCGACTSAALQPDGSLVLTGTTGRFPADPGPTTAPDIHWAVTRLAPDGRVDTGFGSGGVATVPGVSAAGFNVAVLPGGELAVEGQTSSPGIPSLVLTRLTAGGTPDPTFNGGAPVTVPLYSGFPMLLQANGSVVLAGETRGQPFPGYVPGQRKLIRYLPDGTLDRGFGTQGTLDLGTNIDVQQLLPQPGREVLVVATPAASLIPPPDRAAPPGRFQIARLAADGHVDTGLGGAFGVTLDLPFGGGGSSFLVSVKPRRLPPLAQSSFAGRTLLARPDGSYLVPGAVGVRQPTGEGTGRSISRFAVAALTPALKLDPAFGGPAAPLGQAPRLIRQRARTAAARHGVRLSIATSAPGLARVRIKSHRHVIAQSVVPLFTTGRQTLPVELTRRGNRELRHARRVRVTIEVTARDLLATTSRATARGVLR
jgi:uncharacterized delta-60 repeat protein